MSDFNLLYVDHEGRRVHARRAPKRVELEDGRVYTFPGMLRNFYFIGNREPLVRKRTKYITTPNGFRVRVREDKE